MGGSEIDWNEDLEDAIRMSPDAGTTPPIGDDGPNWPLWMSVGVATVGLTSLGLFLAARGSEVPEPEFLISGEIAGTSPDASVDGAVDLRCHYYGGKAIVNATVFLVTERKGEHGLRGRIVQSKDKFDDLDCEDAMDRVAADPDGVAQDVAKSVRSAAIENFVGDGNFNAGAKYAAAIKEAREEAVVPEFEIVRKAE